MKSASNLLKQDDEWYEKKHEFYIHIRRDGQHFDCTLSSQNDYLGIRERLYVNVFSVSETVSDLLNKVVRKDIKDRLKGGQKLYNSCDNDPGELCTDIWRDSGDEDNTEKGLENGLNRYYNRSLELCDRKRYSKIELLDKGKPVSMIEKCGPVLFNRREPSLSISLFEKEYKVHVNSPWISSLSLPPHIVVGYAVTPCTMKTKFVSNQLSKFTWYKNDLSDPAKWIEVGKCLYYTPSAHDVGHILKLRCVPRNEVQEGPSYEVSSCVVENTLPIPDSFPFENRHAYVSHQLSGHSFRIVSYNILAEMYTNTVQAREALKYCPTYAIRIDYRVTVLLKELKGYNSDIICLQEVENKVFLRVLLPELQKLNYQGIFFRKHPKHEEGLACFFNVHRFRVVKKSLLPLPGNSDLSQSSLFSSIRKVLDDHEDLEQRFVGKLNSFMCVALESLDHPSNVLVVGNIHLYYHPDGSQIRLLQIAMATKFLEHTVKTLYYSYCGNARIGVLFCGDFNSKTCSGVYEFMTNGFLRNDHEDWSSNEHGTINSLTLRHSCKLKSAYENVLYTTYVPEFSDCIDYIFYQEDCLKVLQVVPLPEEDVLKEHNALPSVVFPSDHLALVADFCWKQSDVSSSSVNKTVVENKYKWVREKWN